ncbi:MAG TPA: HAD-IB family phosphatase, partial [Sphingomonadales bacterium]
AKTVLVSGGFTFFTDRVAKLVGFQVTRANRLEIVDGKLTGEVIPPIVDAATKLDTLNEFIASDGLQRRDTIAVGDGANDIPMIEAAGLGVAFHAKPKAAAAADVAIRNGDLTALLYLQGFRRDEFHAGA